MTYCAIFTIGIADCLVMKKNGNWPITEAVNNYWNCLGWFFHLSKLYLICRFIYHNSYLLSCFSAQYLYWIQIKNNRKKGWISKFSFKNSSFCTQSPLWQSSIQVLSWLQFPLFLNLKYEKVNGHPPVWTQVNSGLEQISEVHIHSMKYLIIMIFL